MSAAPTLLALETEAPLRIGLIGAPNAGKTTLFNALTGARARVANYAGVTVERREGRVRSRGRALVLLDLPGTYSLAAETPDEAIVSSVLSGELAGEAELDALVVVADATTLGRGLGLVAQVLALGRPTSLVLTMIDEVAARGGALDIERLARLLGCPVLGVVGNRGVGLAELSEHLARVASWGAPAILPPADDPAERFAFADAVLREVSSAPLARDTRTDRIDRVLLHPVAGVAVFALVMVLLFQSIFSWAVPAMDAIDAGFAATARALRGLLGEGLAVDLLTDGVLAGVGSVLVFLPQIAILFTLIHLLEATGYMARAAFVVDRVMGFAGLQGRSFVSLLSSYACAVPGIMAARTIASPRERLATILVAPFMTCSARLPVYTLLIAAFIPAVSIGGVIGLQALVMLGLYLLGVVTALLSAALLSRTLLRGELSRFYMELPPYRIPTLRTIAAQVWRSVWAFIRRAGTIILAASLILWTLLSFPRVDASGLGPEAAARAQLEGSAAASIGRAIEPAIEPLGFDWRIGVGLLASLAAREVIVSTLGQIFAVADADDFGGLRAALQADVDPETGERTFDLPTALSLLVFFVFALQCTSTIAVMVRETGGFGWPAFAFTYMLGLAYAASFVTYRLGAALL